MPEDDRRSGSFTGQITLDDSATECTGLDSGTQQEAASDTYPCLLACLAYVNVHTEAFSMGEIRGQAVLQSDVIVWAFDHSGDQVRNNPPPDGPTDSTGSGRGSFRYELASETLFYTITWADLQAELNKLHVHGPAGPDENNPNHLFEIYNELGDVPEEMRFEGSVTSQISLDAAATACTSEAGSQTMAAPGTLPCLLENRAYVNVHTEAFSMGEIRGNVVTQPPLIA